MAASPADRLATVRAPAPSGWGCGLRFRSYRSQGARGNAGSAALSPLLRVHYGNRRDIHDIVNFRAALQHVYRTAHAHKDRPDGLRAADAREKLVGHVARFQVRENQN